MRPIVCWSIWSMDVCCVPFSDLCDIYLHCYECSWSHCVITRMAIILLLPTVLDHQPDRPALHTECWPQNSVAKQKLIYGIKFDWIICWANPGTQYWIIINHNFEFWGHLAGWVWCRWICMGMMTTTRVIYDAYRIVLVGLHGRKILFGSMQIGI